MRIDPTFYLPAPTFLYGMGTSGVNPRLLKCKIAQRRYKDG
jgi:hypothetical protein